MGETVALAILSLLVLMGGLGVVTSRNVGHAALYLLLSLGSVAGVFIMLLAEFLALVQVLIYGGAVVIVLLFTLMLTRVEEFSRVTDNPQRVMAAVISMVVLGVLTAAFIGFRPVVQPLEVVGIGALGSELFVQWAIPFEVASLVLLVALIGAIIIATGTRKE